jgi:hypothetical protein
MEARVATSKKGNPIQMSKHAKRKRNADANADNNADDTVTVRTAAKLKKRDKKPKTCRFLISASNIISTNSFVVIATKIYGNDSMNEGEDREDTVLISTSTAKEIQQKKEIERTEDKDVIFQQKQQQPPIQKIKKKKKTPVLTTCHLPGANDQPSLDTIVISPHDELAHVHIQKKMYKSIHIYVKPLLVLDVNGILCHRIRHEDTDTLPSTLSSALDHDHQNMQSQMQNKQVYRSSIGHVAHTDIVARTDLVSFLEFLDKYYTLAVWSSAKKKTVKSLVRMLIPDRIQQRLLFVWGQEKCDCGGVDRSPSTQQEEDMVKTGSNGNTIKGQILPNAPDQKPTFHNVIFMKHLSKVWEQFPMWNKSNTLLIDDTPGKCTKFKGNSIHPPRILGLDEDVLCLLKTRVYGIGDDGRDGKSNPAARTLHDDVELRISDGENQARQLRFFQNLAMAWKVISDHEGGDFLMSFLRDNAQDHNMNWQPDI